MADEWIPAAIYLVLCLAAPLGLLFGAFAVRVRARDQSPAKFDTYECGEEPDGVAWVRFHPRYYIVALLFVLFDVEAAFLFPWAVSLRDAGLIAIVDMAIFLGILLVGWAYAVRKGAIEWQ
ncbi:MAG TPA: NADH-quinone oxidoreductase subunit A [Deltaproteobacteria bacterium]|nr:NADH-quinone oxidoreductase subunit A [Deltaproteobacteria bacterium]